MKKFFTLIILAAMAVAANAETIFFWESPEGTPTLIGSVTTGASNEARVNYTNTWDGVTYYTICLNGKKADVDSDNYIEFTPTQAFAAGDVIEVTGYYNKGEEKNCSIYFKYGNGTIVEDDTNFADIQGGVENIKTYTFNVPAEAAGSTTLRMTRNAAGTNIFMTKVVMKSASGGTSVNKVEAAQGTAAKKVLTKNGIVIGKYNVAGAQVK